MDSYQELLQNLAKAADWFEVQSGRVVASDSILNNPDKDLIGIAFSHGWLSKSFYFTADGMPMSRNQIRNTSKMDIGFCHEAQGDFREYLKKNKICKLWVNNDRLGPFEEFFKNDRER